MLAHCRFARRNKVRGFTLVELLIAMGLTLILVLAIAKFYAFVGTTVGDGRAQIEMGGQLRAATQRLKLDFAQMTVKVGSPTDEGANQGCFEIVEGAASDIDVDGNGGFIASPAPYNVNAELTTGDNLNVADRGLMLGDTDDILVMTVRSQGEPFVGRRCIKTVDVNGNDVYQYVPITSNLAEVIWFTTFKDLDGDNVWDVNEPRYLARRQLLILPGPSGPIFPDGSIPGTQGHFFHHNDISAHWVPSGPGTGGWSFNSLGDLSRRENRFVHQNLTFRDNNGLYAANAFNNFNAYTPNPIQLNPNDLNSTRIYSLQDQTPGPPVLGETPLPGEGEDVYLANLLAFDVRVFDPFAPIYPDGDTNGSTMTTNDDNPLGVVTPGDPGYATAIANGYAAVGQGAYVDLWYNRILPQPLWRDSAYSCAPNRLAATNGASYDSWTSAYLRDGLPQFGGGTDLMVDGLDNNNAFGVDDPLEGETRPPYPAYVLANGFDDDNNGTVDDASERPNASFPNPLPPTQLRGVQVRIRLYEPGTRQTRQATVATDFVPE